MDLLGRDFFRVVGVLGALFTFENLVRVAVAMTAVALTLASSGRLELLLAVVVLGVSALVLSVMDSYLVVVRYSSIEAMNMMRHVDDHPL